MNINDHQFFTMFVHILLQNTERTYLQQHLKLDLANSQTSPNPTILSSHFHLLRHSSPHLPTITFASSITLPHSHSPPLPLTHIAENPKPKIQTQQTHNVPKPTSSLPLPLLPLHSLTLLTGTIQSGPGCSAAIPS